MSANPDVDVLIREALGLLSKGEHENALAKADEAFKTGQKPEVVKDVYFSILRSWAGVIAENNFPAMMTESKRLRSMADRSGTRLLVLLRIAIQIKDYSDVIALYADIPEADDDAARGAYREMVSFYRDKQADFDKMVGSWQAKLPVEVAAGTVDKRTAMDQAQALGAFFCNQLEEYDKGLTFFKIANGFQHPNVKALEGMAICYDGMGELQKSIDFLLERLDSVDAFDPAKRQDRAQFQFDIALQYDKSRQLYKALEEYKKVLDLDAGFVFACQNIWLLYDYWGDYQSARNWWKRTVDLYRQQYDVDQFATEMDKLYYYADSLFYANRRKTPPDFDLIEMLYKAYKVAQPEDTDAYIALTRFYVEKRRSIKEGDCYNDVDEASKQAILNETQAALLANFGRGVEVLNAKLSGKPKFVPDKGPLIDLGDLYVAFSYYSEGLVKFQAALDLDNTDSRTQTGIGVCQFKLGKFPEAIDMFRKVLESNPDDLNVECNLADAIRKAGNLVMSGQLYTKILYRAPNYTDAVVGIGECYKSTGDQFLDNKDNEEAAEIFGRAKRYLTMALDNDMVQQASRPLNATELNALHYSLGYTEVRLYEADPKPWSRLLRNARDQFDLVPQTSEQYVKAQSAITAINRRKNVLRKVATLPEKSIFIIAFLLFLGAQTVAIYNWFAKSTVYSIDKKALMDYIDGVAGQGHAAELLKKTVPIYGLVFADKQKLERKLDSLLPDSLIVRMPTDKLAIATTIAGEKEVSPTTYSLFTFGTLFFMIVGLFLPAITKLKVGELELDKNAVDTVKTSPEILVSSKAAAG